MTAFFFVDVISLDHCNKNTFLCLNCSFCSFDANLIGVGRLSINIIANDLPKNSHLDFDIWTLARPCHNPDILTIFTVWQLFCMKLDPGTSDTLRKCLTTFLNSATIYFGPPHLVRGWHQHTRECHLSQYAITHWI